MLRLWQCFRREISLREPGVLASVLALALFLFALPSSQADVGNYSTFWAPAKQNHSAAGVDANHYLNDDHPNQQQLSDIKTGRVTFTAEGRTSKRGELFQGVADAEGGIGLKDSSYRYLNVTELYAGLHVGPHFELDIGRKLESWSKFEEIWSLGLFNPRFRWDYVHEHPDGLAGAFADFNSEYVQIVGYGTPIFVPEQGAPFTFTNGRCTTSSPWFNCPGAAVSLFNQPTDVYYKLEIPPVGRFVNRPGRGAIIRIGKERGFWIKGSYARKAINQVLLAYQGYLSLSTESLPATIHARAYDHELWASEFGYTADRWALFFSGIVEHPIRDVTPSYWNTQEESRSKYFGPTLFTRLLGEGEGETTLDISMLKREGGNPPEAGPFANPSSPVFEPRHSFQNAYSVGFRTPVLPNWGHYFWLTSRYIFDKVHRGTILIADLNGRPAERLFLNLGIDLLGSDDPGNADFISRYQRNDRLRGGLKYVF